MSEIPEWKPQNWGETTVEVLGYWVTAGVMATQYGPKPMAVLAGGLSVALVADHAREVWL